MNWFGSLLKSKLTVFGLLLLVFVAEPWWLALLLAAAAIVTLPNFYLGLAIGILLDAVYGAAAAAPFHLGLPFTLMLLVIYLLAPPVKSRLTFSFTNEF